MSYDVNFSFFIRCWMLIDFGISVYGKFWKRVKEIGRNISIIL